MIITKSFIETLESLFKSENFSRPCYLAGENKQIERDLVEIC